MLKLIPATDWDNHPEWFSPENWEFIKYIKIGDTILAEVRYWENGIE